MLFLVIDNDFYSMSNYFVYDIWVFWCKFEYCWGCLMIGFVFELIGEIDECSVNVDWSNYGNIVKIKGFCRLCNWVVVVCLVLSIIWWKYEFDCCNYEVCFG